MDFYSLLRLAHYQTGDQADSLYDLLELSQLVLMGTIAGLQEGRTVDPSDATCSTVLATVALSRVISGPELGQVLVEFPRGPFSSLTRLEAARPQEPALFFLAPVPPASATVVRVRPAAAPYTLTTPQGLLIEESGRAFHPLVDRELWLTSGRASLRALIAELDPTGAPDGPSPSFPSPPLKRCGGCEACAAWGCRPARLAGTAGPAAAGFSAPPCCEHGHASKAS